MPKISVIIPCYNQGAFLNEAVESILDQSFQDFEIIVVNDGSTDSFTIELLNDYDQPKTTVLHTGNQGLASARNNGIREAVGEYILPLDADDRIGPTYLEEAINVLEENSEIGIVYCEAEYFGERSGPWHWPRFEMGRMLADNIIFCSGFFRRKDWERVGGYNPNMIYGWEDWDFWLSILELDRRVHRIPKVLFYYRVTENSMIGGMSQEKQHLMRLHVCMNHKNLYRNITRLDLSLRFAQVFVDTGLGFNEKEAVSRVIAEGENRIEFDLHEFTPIQSIRLDPANDCVAFRVISLNAVTRDNRYEALAQHNDNAYHRNGSLFFFTTTDPWILFNPPESGIEKLVAEIDYIAFGPATYQYIMEQKYTVMMEQAKQIQSDAEQIRSQVGQIALQNRQIQWDNAHIGNLESELKNIKSLVVWKLFTPLMLMEKTFVTMKQGGFRTLWSKVKNYLQKRRDASGPHD